LHEGERLADAVTRSLTQKAGVTGGHPAQLAVFDDPHRDERGWVLSVAHLAVIPYAALAGALLADPDLLGPRLTIRELHEVHEAIAGTTLQKDTFRRAMEPHLQGTGTLSTGTVGRPSQRFRRAR